MKIHCTVQELGQIIRGCAEIGRNYSCTRCPLYEVCSNVGIETMVTPDTIIRDDESKEEENP